ncbi:unnamed protein product [Chrysodeixis includens]|uniref:Uncharacterized protein n=1 Tax=Chrysodeixis includens TaxID=689277 RepID=A0A9N8L3Z8_CHRIL|nr:unnamed protein product [Chrysodeixis includens]
MTDADVACFSCLIPSAVSFNLLAAKAVAGQAAQDLAAIKADTIGASKAAVLKAVSDITDIATSGLVQKGQALQAAAGAILSSILNGATSAGSTLARAGIDMVAAKLGLIDPPVPHVPFVEEAEAVTEVSTQKAQPISAVVARTSPVEPQPQPLVKVTPHKSHHHKSHHRSHKAHHSSPVYTPSGNGPIVYEIMNTPEGYNGPLRFRFN